MTHRYGEIERLEKITAEIEKEKRNERFALRNEVNGKPFPDSKEALSEYAKGITLTKEEYLKRLEGGTNLCGGGSFTGKSV